MNLTATNPEKQRLRLLVAIASYGRKNDSFLRRIIGNYQSMAMDVDIIVLSEAPKDIGAGIRVVAGLPSKNPWSLPFGHKQILAENVERYDLFAYSEDDMEVTEQNVQAFLRVAASLEADEIAGFLRYETDPSGIRHLPEAHASAHWKPESVKRRRDCIVAEYSNEHAAFYLLTREQLRKAIASGGFLRGPCEGRYDMLCTAATDPYTNCGFRKVICISALEDFLIHHLPNRYVGQLGLPLSAFTEQVQILMAIADGKHPASTLCGLDSKLMNGQWSKDYDEKPDEKLLSLVPRKARTLLSVGCGSGATETRLIQRGLAVTALPLDSVVGVAAAKLGVEVVYGNWEEGLRHLAGKKFDCVLISNLLHLQTDPVRLMEGIARLMGGGGTLLVKGPNFNRVPIRIKQYFGTNGYRKLGNFTESGINRCGPGTFLRQIKKMGLDSARICWLDQELSKGKWNRIRLPLGGLTARNWILQARRSPKA
jgi:SAM-dependent methyltransferase